MLGAARLRPVGPTHRVFEMLVPEDLVMSDQKIPLLGIVFHWKEGNSEVDREIQSGAHNCQTFAEANRKVRIWAKDAPKEYGYDKLRFTVKWINGDSFTGRYDLVHPCREEPCLVNEIRRSLEAYESIPETRISAEDKADALRVLREVDMSVA